MATLRKQIALDAGAANVWSAVRDFGQVHTRVAPGFLTKLEMDKGDRVITFFNGLVARERLVTVDDAFAWDEGEGDRTRRDWLAMHVRYFSARAMAENFTFDESMPAVFERFTLVWPPGDADPEEAGARG